jgi:folylpolyglutamate synthase
VRVRSARENGLTSKNSEELSAIHVAGTKGKGSVCQFAESVARAHGVSTGTFVSPHLVEPRERIRLNGRPISRDLFSKYFFETAELLAAEGGALPPFFRFLNCMAFLVFQREGVELAVVEVGVGGEQVFVCKKMRVSSTSQIRTNVFDKCAVSCCDGNHASRIRSHGCEEKRILCVFFDLICLSQVLGPTLTDIAFEKAGIMKQGVPCVSANQLAEPREQLVRQAELRGSHLFFPENKTLPADVLSQLELQGDYQRENAAIGLLAARYWLAHRRSGTCSVAEQKKRFDGALSDLSRVTEIEAAALRSTRWRGRAQTLEHRGSRLFIDGAHTAESCELACKWFASSAGKEKRGQRVLVANFKPNKQVDAMLEHLSQQQWDLVVFCPSAATGTHNCSWQRDLKSRWQSLSRLEATVAGNLSEALSDVAPGSDVMVTGSLYLVGAVLELVKWPVDDL